MQFDKLLMLSVLVFLVTCDQQSDEHYETLFMINNDTKVHVFDIIVSPCKEGYVLKERICKEVEDAAK